LGVTTTLPIQNEYHSLFIHYSLFEKTAVLFSACAATLLAPSVPAIAHGFAGARFFPATIATDDPFVANELSLPTFQSIRQPGAPPTKTFDLSADVALKLTPNFGVEVGDGYMLQKSPGSRLRTGFDNVEVGGKYQFLVSAEHEAIVSVGLNAEMGAPDVHRLALTDSAQLHRVCFSAKVWATCLTQWQRSGHLP
jgi:hypothetical protein